jgi:hypothetical protein
MDEKNELYGELFGSIPLTNEDHLQVILDTMDQNNAVYILTQAIKYAYNQGAYSLGESEVLSKSIRILNKSTNTTNNDE